MDFLFSKENRSLVRYDIKKNKIYYKDEEELH